MKFLKGLGIGIAVLGVIYLILALFGPAKVHVERSMMINTDAQTVYNEINNLTHWKSWSYWDNIDPKMQSTFEGPESGVGQKHSWKSENDSVGNGSLTITKSEAGKFVETTLEFEGMGTSIGGWTMKDTSGGTLVTTYMDMETPFLFRPMMLFVDMDKILGSDFEKSLAGLKDHCESLSKAMVAEYVTEMSNLPGVKIMSIKDSGTVAEIPMKFGALYGEIGAEMKRQGLSQAGPPVAIYDTVLNRPDGSMYFIFSAGIPVDKAGKSTARVKYWESNPANAAVKCNYYGGYSNIGACHGQINQFIMAHGKTINGPVWEVYVSDPGLEPDSTKWLTEIYYPVR